MKSTDQISLARTGTERCLHACWQASLALALQVQPQRFACAIQAAFAKALAPNRRVQLVEAVSRVHRDVTLDGHDHGPVLSWSGGHVAPLSRQVHHRITLNYSREHAALSQLIHQIRL